MPLKATILLVLFCRGKKLLFFNARRFVPDVWLVSWVEL